MNKTEQKTLMELLGEMEDHRKGNAVRYRLDEVLIIGILSILCNGMTFTAMEMFGKTHLKELRQFMELKNGIPSHDTFGDVFSSIDPNAAARCFEIWLGDMKAELAGLEKGEANGHIVAIDGKTIRRSKHESHKAYHIVTAFCSDLQLVLGQQLTEEKSNEITAIPELLKLLTIQGCTVTIDALGTQRDIASAIRGKDADYILAVKGNQSELYEFLQLRAKSELPDAERKRWKAAGRYAETVEKGHGRVEKRECWLFPDLGWYDRAKEWKDVAGFALIRSVRTLADGTASAEDRYYIYSRAGLTAEEFLQTQRAHWRIENSLHWSLDVTFKEDSAHIRLGNAAVILNIFRKLVMQMLKADTSVKGSVQSKLLRCAWDFDYALSVIQSYAFPSDASGS